MQMRLCYFMCSSWAFASTCQKWSQQTDDKVVEPSHESNETEGGGGGTDMEHGKEKQNESAGKKGRVHFPLSSRFPLPSPHCALKQAVWMVVIYNMLSLSIAVRWYEVNQGGSNERLRIYFRANILSVVSVMVAVLEQARLRREGEWRAIKLQWGPC